MNVKGTDTPPPTETPKEPPPLLRVKEAPKEVCLQTEEWEIHFCSRCSQYADVYLSVGFDYLIPSPHVWMFNEYRRTVVHYGWVKRAPDPVTWKHILEAFLKRQVKELLYLRDLKALIEGRVSREVCSLSCAYFNEARDSFRILVRQLPPTHPQN